MLSGCGEKKEKMGTKTGRWGESSQTIRGREFRGHLVSPSYFSDGEKGL
jgi:hypothetical protein